MADERTIRVALLQHKLFEKTGVDVAFHKFLVAHDALMEGNGGLDPFNDVLIEGPGHPLDRFLAGVGVDDQLGDHRIVMRKHGVLVVHGTVDPNTQPAGGVVAVDLAGEWGELHRIFSVDAAFDGVPADLDIFLLESKRQPCGAANLLLDDIDTGDHFGDGMLNLHAGVHFHEIEIPVLIEQEFDGADAGVVDLFSGIHRSLPHLLAQLLAEHGSMSFWWRR